MSCEKKQHIKHWRGTLLVVESVQKETLFSCTYLVELL